MTKLALNTIKTDGGTQARAALNEAVVAEYAESIKAGDDLPPVTVFHDGKAHWLADGFHRFHAYRKAGAIEIDADIRQGTKREAILHSVGANANHGLRRTNDDKRCAVRTLLKDREWGKWSDREVAKACGVSVTFVSAIRNPETAAKQQANRDASAVKRGVVGLHPEGSEAHGSSLSAAPNPSPMPTPAPAAAPASQISQEAAVSHIHALLDAKRAQLEQSAVGTEPEPPAPAPVEPADLGELDEARQQLAEMADLLQGYESATADEKSKAKEFARLHAQIRTVESQRNQYMTTCDVMKKRVKALERDVAKLTKQLEKKG